MSVMTATLAWSGFTLVEVLISLSILAAGLLGMTALQHEALQYNHAAYLESQALFMLNDMVERIRANSAGNAYAIDFTEDEPASPPDCTVIVCDSLQMSRWDVSEWRGMVKNTNYLPGAESEITVNPATGEYTVSIRYEWDNRGGTGKRTVSITTRI